MQWVELGGGGAEQATITASANNRSSSPTNSVNHIWEQRATLWVGSELCSWLCARTNYMCVHIRLSTSTTRCLCIQNKRKMDQNIVNQQVREHIQAVLAQRQAELRQLEQVYL